MGDILLGAHRKDKKTEIGNEMNIYNEHINNDY